MFVLVAGFRFPTFRTSLLHCIALSKRVYGRVINMADEICPASIIICRKLLLNPPVFPPSHLSENLHASLNMFSAEEPYVPLPLM